MDACRDRFSAGEGSFPANELNCVGLIDVDIIHLAHPSFLVDNETSNVQYAT